jgi:hypothetical protein
MPWRSKLQANLHKRTAEIQINKQKSSSYFEMPLTE